MRVALLISILFFLSPKTIHAQENRQVTLPNGWKISPIGEMARSERRSAVSRTHPCGFCVTPLAEDDDDEKYIRYGEND